MFDWSSLPTEIKRIILKLNRLSVSHRIELSQFRHGQIYVNRAILGYKPKPIKLKLRSGICHYKDYQIGYK